MKTIVRRNLPINDVYLIKDSFYTGTENGTCCDNCGKYITNVAVIANADNKLFNVGLDCAETLSSLKGLDRVIADFKESKSVRAKVNKAIKAGKEIAFEATQYGQIKVSFNGTSVDWLNTELAKKYLPDYVVKVINPKKLGFVPVKVNILDTYPPKEYFENGKQYSISGFDVLVTYGDFKPFTNTNGQIIINKGFTVALMKSGKELKYSTFCSIRDINSRTEYLINELLFNAY